ncbi:hypothetical protein CTA1_4447 [Colletotrichum tanaceti]|uniref:Uncharacterized protein n=1 Tax=Colletotrichum tanaceti TaxID=1306861 RepID=A0A4U6XFJ2_9PEZI|nr:hypothetical protein CTA1_4447 [Colletotrichum tanaceti]
MVASLVITGNMITTLRGPDDWHRWLDEFQTDAVIAGLWQYLDPSRDAASRPDFEAQVMTAPVRPIVSRFTAVVIDLFDSSAK